MNECGNIFASATLNLMGSNVKIHFIVISYFFIGCLSVQVDYNGTGWNLGIIHEPINRPPIQLTTNTYTE
jgi:hypothetical protein